MHMDPCTYSPYVLSDIIREAAQKGPNAQVCRKRMLQRKVLAGIKLFPVGGKVIQFSQFSYFHRKLNLIHLLIVCYHMNSLVWVSLWDVSWRLKADESISEFTANIKSDAVSLLSELQVFFVHSIMISCHFGYLKIVKNIDILKLFKWKLNSWIS